MKWSACLLLIFVLLITGLSPSADAQFAHTRGKEIVDANGQPLHLHGINLGNWMVPEGYMWHFTDGPQSPREIEALVAELIGPERASLFWQTYRDTYYSQADLRRIKRMGFDSVRVPIHYRFFTADNAEGFLLLDRVVQWSRAEGLLVIIDLHAAPGGQTGTNIDDSNGYPWLFTDKAAQQQTIDLWRRIARHYSKEPAVLGYDLLNEPLPHYPSLRPLDRQLKPLYMRIAAAIRTEDKNHILILGGAKWDSDFSVFTGAGKPPFDSNVVYQLHTYWTPPVQTTVQKYVDFRESEGVPIWLGESGENTDEWVAQFARLLEKNDIGWAFWPYKKMDNTSSPVTFSQPEGWDQVTAYAKLDRGLGHVEDRLKKRPDQDVIDRAFASLLERIQFGSEHVNPGYLHALLPSSTAQ